MLSTIPAESGSYALILHLPENRRIIVGALGAHDFGSGYYLYAGSAFGPGGLHARVRRHLLGGRRHWHVDYLRTRCELLQVWWSADASARERDWARILARWLGPAPVKGFGASDSPLCSHLFYAGTRPRFETFESRLMHRHGDHARLRCTAFPPRGS